MKINKRPQKKHKRNLELISDYNEGMKTIDMIVKYRISSTRIYQILEDYKDKSNDIKL